MTSVFDLKLLPHISPIYSSIIFSKGFKILTLLLNRLNVKTHFQFLLNRFILLLWNSFCSKTVMSKNWYVKNSPKPFKAVNARCIFSYFLIQRCPRRDLIGRLAIIVIGWHRNTWCLYASLSWVSLVAITAVHDSMLRQPHQLTIHAYRVI